MNINNPTTFAAPNLTLSTSNSSGTSGALRADDTILVYDTTVPGTIAYGQSAATGSQAVSARRDHVHGMATTVAQADQASLEAEDDENTYVPPDLVRFSPGVAKAWCRMGTDGVILGSDEYPDSYNVASTSQVSTGSYVVTWRDDFSQTTYSVFATCAEVGSFCSTAGPTAQGSCPIFSVTADTGVVVNIRNSVVAFGDQ